MNTCVKPPVRAVKAAPPAILKAAQGAVMKRRVSILFLLAALSGGIPSQGKAQDEPKRGPSTPEERKRFLALTHKLEEAPLDKSLYVEKKWAKQWIEDIPDINVNICPVLLGQEFMLSRYKYAPNLEYQVMFGNVAFLIEHPDKKDDTVAQYTAGVESALKAYKGILRADPEVSREMEELLRKQSQGKLVDFVKESSKACQDTGQSGL